jgi:outer membrane protein TolC
MPPAPDRCAAETLPPLHLVHRAKQLRPEWEQLRQGRLAARAWEKAERSANYPVLFLAGQLRYGHAPTRDTDQNPWHFDNYNTVTGGLAVGLKFDLDPMLVAARAQEARAKLTQVDALAAQATTGIDVQVRRAHADLLRARRSQQISQMGLVATRQWMNSAATAYQSGVGEARDLLEGLAAYVQAKRAMLESLLSYHVAAAELDHAVGTISSNTP